MALMVTLTLNKTNEHQLCVQKFLSWFKISPKACLACFRGKQITPKHFQKSSKETKAVKVVIPTPYESTNIVRLVFLARTGISTSIHTCPLVKRLC